MRWGLIVAVLVLAAGLGLGRTWSQAGGGVVAVADVVPVFGVQDNGRTVAMERGARFAIELESNPSTGFKWDLVEPLPASVDLVSEGRSGGGSGEQVGTPGRQRFEFAATAAGKGDIVLGYSRSWEKGVEPAKAFRLGVSVD